MYHVLSSPKERGEKRAVFGEDRAKKETEGQNESWWTNIAMNNIKLKCKGVPCLLACKEELVSYSRRGVYGGLFLISQCFALVLNKKPSTRVH